MPWFQAVLLGLEIVREGMRLVEIGKKAQAEGRDLTAEELEQVDARRDAAKARIDDLYARFGLGD